MGKRKSWMISIRSEEAADYLIKRHRYLSFDANKRTIIDETDFYEVKRLSCLERFKMWFCCEG